MLTQSPRTPINITTPSVQKGFNIIEILITVAIASIALAALAQLQMTSVKGNHGALLASYAAMHARDMSERITANAIGAASLAGAKTVVAHYHIDLWDSTIASPTKSPECEALSTTTACTPASRATTDYALWLEAISNNMPPGTEAQVCVDTERFTAGSFTNQQVYSLSNLPDCEASSTITYTENTTLIQNSFPITYYIHIAYPFRGNTLGMVIPVQLDAYAQVNQ